MAFERFFTIQQMRLVYVVRLCLATMLLFPSACAPRYVQLAQDSFSKGATIENAAAFPTLAGAGATVPATNGGALIHYIDARDNIRLALNKQKSELDSDGLTGTAFALQAMISWRLDALQGSTLSSGDPCAGTNYRDCAKTSSEQALAQIKDQTTLNAGSFMMLVMPGLLDHNLGRKATAQTPKNASDDFRSAYDHIDDGLKKLGATTSPISGTITPAQQLVMYGLLAQYQTLRAWYGALYQASSADASVPSDQRLTGDQRRSCLYALIQQNRAREVMDKLAKLDPNEQLISQKMARDMRASLDLSTPIPSGSCPWASS
jgi:hypothetical protein